MKKWSEYFQSVDGSVESALVMIPLIALFLITLQLIVTVNYRNLDLTVAQNRASFQAAQQDIYPEDQVIDMDPANIFNDFKLIVVKIEREIPKIFPGVNSLIGEKKLKSPGVALIEDSGHCYGGILCY